MRLSKSSVGKISSMAIFLIVFITLFLILRQTGIVKAQSEITGYETAGIASSVIDNQTLSNLTVNSSEVSIDVKLDYPQKVTRGEFITAKASVSNIGSSSVKNVVIMWKLANGFEVVSGNLEEICGDLEIMNTCISEVEIKTDNLAMLGTNEIKVVVNYE